MKRYISIAIAVAAALCLTGCFHDFLDRSAQGIAREVDLSNPVLMSTSIYSSFLNFSEAGGDAMLTMGEIASDNALRGSTLSDLGGLRIDRMYNQFQNFCSINAASTNYIGSLWVDLYGGIGQANINLRSFDRLFPDMDPDLKKALVAENRLVRGLFYMFLVNTFGEVVLLPEEEVTPREYAELTNDKSIPELYDCIVADMRAADDGLPTRDEWKSNFGMEWQGRAHKGSGQGYLAKALLYQAANELYFNHDAAKAADCYNEIVQIVSNMDDSQLYPLYDDYEQMFRPEGNFCPESLFEVGTKSTTDGTTCFVGLRGCQPRNNNGVGRMGPTINLINQYEKDDAGNILDKRHYGTVLYGAAVPLAGMSYPGNNQPSRMIYGKTISGAPGAASAVITGRGWPNRFGRKTVQPDPVPSVNITDPIYNPGGTNLKLLRMGEVLMIGAEAAYWAGNYDQARIWLKKVRTRAGLDNTAIDALSGQPLLDQIWKDKRLEIALEWSNRYYELVRIDKIYPGYMKAAMNAKVKDELDAIGAYLDHNTDNFTWVSIYSSACPMTKESYRSLLPLCSELQIPKHYTLPISTKVFQTMLKVQQTQYYR